MDELPSLPTDDNKLTIMDVPFANQTDYRAALNAVVSAMYSGFRPAKKDIAFLAKNSGRQVAPKDVLAWVKENYPDLFK
ncbi:hypothetical protein EFT87_10615 [Schleiferilactobacillus harbinensis]|uniref:hypothetical protein n=1 Tax=Schleiferilactobacillus harbinensis TaxID=304207 RepID=UPI0021A8503E|nr:hypothetical protein [Schleiferilactobacillus harbinensis]MCT2909107.1 hypothetical protein [Schleiferilactobacillus harbinensis]